MKCGGVNVISHRWAGAKDLFYKHKELGLIPRSRVEISVCYGMLVVPAPRRQSFPVIPWPDSLAQLMSASRREALERGWMVFLKMTHRAVLRSHMGAHTCVHTASKREENQISVRVRNEPERNLPASLERFFCEMQS